MTPEAYAAEVAVELAARNADIPFDAVLMLEQKTWPPGGPKITPKQTVELWFQMQFVVSMTEAEWDIANDPSPMLKRVRFQVSNQKFTRFACACCRRIWDLMPGDDVRRIVEATEGVLQDRLSRDERDEFFDVLTESFMEGLSGGARSAARGSCSSWGSTRPSPCHSMRRRPGPMAPRKDRHTRPSGQHKRHCCGRCLVTRFAVASTSETERGGMLSLPFCRFGWLLEIDV